ncbi:hypothetical protein GC163_19320 [bacterium]|nr:hypothetical protein [bacterium]
MPTARTEPMLADQLLDTLNDLLLDAESQAKPLEVDPFRSRVFELFVTAHGAGYLKAGAPDDLTADGLCREFGERWGLADALRGTAEPSAAIKSDHVAKLRLLWSLMRLWMEWSYAWDRWEEFHQSEAN